MRFITTLSIQSKIVIIVLAVCFIVISLSVGAFSYLYIKDTKQESVYQSKMQAKMIGEYCVAALSFNYPQRAEEILQKLRNNPSVEHADLYNETYTLFASYPSKIDSSVKEVPYKTSMAFYRGDYIEIFEPILFNNETYGFIHLTVNTHISQRIKTQFIFVCILLAATMLMALLMASRLQKLISNPIITLSHTTMEIARSNDYSTRVVKLNYDEIGDLYDNFNLLLDEIQQKEKQRDEAIASLEDHKLTLEQKINERTDILMSTQKELIENAHKAGMADIASGALHNVGNILNSIKTSSSLIKEYLKNSPYQKFKQANELLKQNMHNIKEFILNDPKGVKLLQYYLEIESMQRVAEEKILEHVDRLIDKVNSSVDVIHAQQSYASSASLTELFNICEVIDSAIMMENSSLEKYSIAVIKKFRPVPNIMLQRTKLVHIIINLINNAKDAMHDIPHEKRTLTFSVAQEGSSVFVKVSDTGHGIAPNNFNNIFTHGFTTKKNGHGFGLHSCANYMTEMGGKMSVESDGPETGATFILQFPLSH